jgi:phosphoribosyl 1,2-cyclic phosphodiesterase
MRVKFWGVRGSTPTPERRNSRYGGNTCCIEIRLANGTLIILDAGSGIRGLGKTLISESAEHPIHGYVFMTHFHWDHIQGIPFFLPLYRKGNVFLFHSVLRKGLELREAVEGQMVSPYFPVDMGAMGALRHFYDLDANPINLNGAIISSAPLNHPQECVAYRIEADGAVFVLATDTEPGSPFHDRAIRELAQGADVLVYDAQYTPEQVAGEKKGWGHSSWLEGTRIARECRVKQLVLFHHDPDSDDYYVDGLAEKARQEFPNSIGASEGMIINLPQGYVSNVSLKEGYERRREHRYRIEVPLRVSWKAAGREKVETQAVTQDVSKSGIYFVAPTGISPDQPLELEMVVPDEITHRGEVGFRFIAHPVRMQETNGANPGRPKGLGVGARKMATGEDTSDSETSLAGDEPEEKPNEPTDAPPIRRLR